MLDMPARDQNISVMRTGAGTSLAFRSNTMGATNIMARLFSGVATQNLAADAANQSAAKQVSLSSTVMIMFRKPARPLTPESPRAKRLAISRLAHARLLDLPAASPGMSPGWRVYVHCRKESEKLLRSERALDSEPRSRISMPRHTRYDVRATG